MTSITFKYDKEDLQREIFRLENNIAQLKSDVKFTNYKIKDVEQKIDIFLEKYYEECKIVERKSGRNKRFTRLNKPKEQYRDMYIKLSDDYHPTKVGGDHIYREVKIAYKAEDYAALELLGLQAANQDDSDEQRLLRLSTEYDQLVVQYDRLQGELTAKLDSSAYKLREKVIRSTMYGHDIMQDIRDRLEESA